MSDPNIGLVFDYGRHTVQVIDKGAMHWRTTYMVKVITSPDPTYLGLIWDVDSSVVTRARNKKEAQGGERPLAQSRIRVPQVRPARNAP